MNSLCSEKLRALGQAHERGFSEGIITRNPHLLMDALPQIVAVVEAAERVDPRKHVMDRDEERGRKRILRRALAALDEALLKDAS